MLARRPNRRVLACSCQGRRRRELAHCRWSCSYTRAAAEVTAWSASAPLTCSRAAAAGAPPSPPGTCSLLAALGCFAQPRPSPDARCVGPPRATQALGICCSSPRPTQPPRRCRSRHVVGFRMGERVNGATEWV
ncbi:hypothetical protein DAI22_08g064950 [Oryza sativa Japonica Group]|nr:hypothetical protein DAI22_08g064950 [Oryza sativa Japonica Group]